MYPLDVSLQVVALCGAVFTVFTGVRLLTGVNPLVSPQVSAVTSLVTAPITKQPQSLSVTWHQHLLWRTVPHDKLACRVPCPADIPRLREKNMPSCSLGSIFYSANEFSKPDQDSNLLKLSYFNSEASLVCLHRLAAALD